MYQEGGNIFVPFIPGASGTGSSSSVKESSTTEDDNKLPEIDKELISILKSNELLPSDMSAIITLTKQFYSSGLSGMTGTSSYMSSVLNILQKVSDAKMNVSKQKSAVDRLKDQDAFGDVALDSYGRMYVTGEEGITAVTPDTYYANQDEYNPISYSELLNARENSPQLAFNTSMLGTIESAIGITTVEKWLTDTIKEFGKKEKVGYFTANSAAQAGLLELANSDGMYKITTTKEYDDALEATKQLLIAMPKRYRNVLAAHAAVSSLDPSKDLPEFVLQYILRNTDNILNINYDSSASTAVRNGGASEEELKNLKAKNYTEKLATGVSTPKEQMRIFGRDSQIDLTFQSQNMGNIVKNEQMDPIGSGMLDVIRDNAYAIKDVANQETVQFGNQEFTKGMQGSILYDGGPVYRMKLPATTNEKGDIIVDFRAIDLMKQIEENTPNLKSYTPEMLEQLLKQYDPRLYVDENGEIAWSESAYFLSFEGIIGNNYDVDVQFDERYMSKIPRQEEGHLKEQYENALKYGFVNPANGTKERAGHNAANGWWFTNHDFIKSKVYMPITRPLAGADEYYSAGSRTNNLGVKYTNDRQLEIQRQTQMGQRITSF